MSASPLRADMLSICINVCKVPVTDIVEQLVPAAGATPRRTSVVRPNESRLA